MEIGVYLVLGANHQPKHKMLGPFSVHLPTSIAFSYTLNSVDYIIFF